MVTVQIEELQQNAQKCLSLAKQGDEKVVTEGGEPVLQITALPRPTKGLRPIGLAKGQFTVPDDFDDPLPEDI